MPETAVKERPILFSAPMVRAILAGKKTQTRRTWKLPSGAEWYAVGDAKQDHYIYSGFPGWWHVEESECPYGKPGDCLWVRETWASTRQAGESSPWVVYRADDPDWQTMEGWKWKPSIFMPRAASRITLEITEIRVERLHEITEQDAAIEGLDGNCGIGHIPSYQAGPLVYHFARLWETINGKDSWAANPWVWVVPFRRITN